MGFVASLWDFISGSAIAPSQSPGEESFAVSFILVPHPLTFCLSIPLFFSYLFILHALLNKNRTFLFNMMRLLNISANFAVDYQHH